MRITNSSHTSKKQTKFKAAEVYIAKNSINIFKSIKGFDKAIEAEKRVFNNLAYQGQDIKIFIKHLKDHNENDFTIIATAPSSNNLLRVSPKFLNEEGESISSSMLEKKDFISIGSLCVKQEGLNEKNTDAGKNTVKTLVQRVSEVTKSFTQINLFLKPWLKEIENPDSFERII